MASVSLGTPAPSPRGRLQTWPARTASRITLAFSLDFDHHLLRTPTHYESHDALENCYPFCCPCAPCAPCDDDPRRSTFLLGERVQVSDWSGLRRHARHADGLSSKKEKAHEGQGWL